MGLRMSRFAQMTALTLGILVIVGSVVGGIALASTSGRGGSTPAVMTGDESQGPGQKADDQKGSSTQEPGDDSDHHPSASPGASCDRDDSMVGATPTPWPAASHDADPDADCRSATGHDD